MKKSVFLVLAKASFAFVLLFLFSCGGSRRIVGLEQGWEMLGEAKVNFVRDKDVIEVKSRDAYTAIRFVIEEKDVRINDLKIHLINGDVLQPALNDVIRSGEQSRVIELAADGRIIERIEFTYRSMGSILEGRAGVFVIGRRYNPVGGF